MMTLLRLSNRLKEHIFDSSHAPPGVRLRPNEVVYSRQDGALWSSPSLTWDAKTLILAGEQMITTTTSPVLKLWSNSGAANMPMRVDFRGADAAGKALSRIEVERTTVLGTALHDMKFLTYNGTTLVEGIHILSDGSVGVGKTPVYPFDVSGQCNAGRYSIDGGGFCDSSTSALLQMGDLGNNFTRTSFYHNNGEMITMKSGFVGIGTATPAAPFEIANSQAEILRLNRVGTRTWSVDLSSGFFQLVDLTGNKTPLTIETAVPDNTLYIDGLGDIGIGWSSPSAKMDVNGVMRARGVDWVATTVTGSTTCTLGTNSPSSASTPTTWKRETFINSANEVTVGYTPVFV